MAEPGGEVVRHDWQEVAKLNPESTYISDYQVRIGVQSLPRRVWWCQRCGMVKDGPYAEQASWGWYSYRRACTTSAGTIHPVQWRRPVAEPVWQGRGAWLTRRGCAESEPLKWELGVTGEVTRMSAEALRGLRRAIDAQLGMEPCARCEADKVDAYVSAPVCPECGR